MKQWIVTKKPSVMPFYMAALCWLLCGVLLPLYRLWALGLTAVLSVAVFMVGRKVCPMMEVHHQVDYTTGVADADAMVQQIEEQLELLRQVNRDIPDPALSEAMNRMEAAGHSILQELMKNPAKARAVRRFANYYLPDAVKILSAYAQVEKASAKGAHSDQVRREVQANAASIAQAFENQLDSLYADTALDISTDIEVLQGMLKGQGLGGQQGFGVYSDKTQ